MAKCEIITEVPPPPPAPEVLLRLTWVEAADLLRDLEDSSRMYIGFSFNDCHGPVHAALRTAGVRRA